MAELGGGNALSGAAGAGINESLQKQLKQKYKDNPDAWQWVSAVIGTAAGQIVGGDAQTGASTAASGTKNNDLAPTLQNELAYAIRQAENKEEIIALLENAITSDQGQLPFGTEEGLKESLEDAGYQWDESLDFKGNLNKATGEFKTQENKPINNPYPINQNNQSQDADNEKNIEAMGNSNQTTEEKEYPQTIETEKIKQGIEGIINWLTPEEIDKTGEKIPEFMEKGAIINNGKGYYLRGMGENGTDAYIQNVKPGSLCYNKDGQLCIIGKDSQLKEFNWGKETTITGRLNT